MPKSRNIESIEDRLPRQPTKQKSVCRVRTDGNGSNQLAARLRKEKTSKGSSEVRYRRVRTDCTATYSGPYRYMKTRAYSNATLCQNFKAISCELGGYSRAVSGQRVGKHIPAATITHATGETGCCLRGPRRGMIKKRTGTGSSVDGW
jgi:hypothetical protein